VLAAIVHLVLAGCSWRKLPAALSRSTAQQCIAGSPGGPTTDCGNGCTSSSCTGSMWPERSTGWRAVVDSIVGEAVEPASDVGAGDDPFDTAAVAACEEEPLFGDCRRMS
jgi:hypothetical protein